MKATPEVIEAARAAWSTYLAARQRGEDAGRPVEALCLATIGINSLSLRSASIGPVKHMLMRTDLDALKHVIDEARNRGDSSVRQAVMDFLLNGDKG